MFKAVVRGKSGGVRSDIQNDDAVSSRIGLDIPSIREDVLSAAVFTRLSYMPANRFWQLLCSIYSNLPYREHVELKNIEFWPTWSHPDEKRKFVEPDIFLQFDIGDPKKSVDLIIEVKRFETGTVQSYKQHIDQISCYFADEEMINKGDTLYFLTLGGLGNEPEGQVEKLRQKALDQLDYETFKTPNIGGASWSMMSNAVSNQSKYWPETNKLLLSDLKEILIYAGFKKRVYFSEAMSPTRPNLNVKMLDVLYKKEA